MFDRTVASVVILTAVIGVHLISVLHASTVELLPPSDDEDAQKVKYIDTIAHSIEFFKEIQKQSDLFDSLVKLVLHSPSEEEIDSDYNHCVSVKKGAAVDIFESTIDVFVDQCTSSLRTLEEAVNNRVKEFLVAIKSLDHLAYEDALACVQLGNQINYEPILKCLENVLSYRELSFNDYLEEMRQNYLTFNRRVEELNECGEDVITLIEDEIQTLLADIRKCVYRIEFIEAFFELTYDESEELSGDRGKAFVTDVVTFSLSIIMDRIDKLNKQLGRGYYHSSITDLIEDTANVVVSHKETLDSIAKTAMVKVEDTEKMGARFNQCTTTIAEETNIRMTLAIAKIHECVDEAKQIYSYFTDGILSYGEEIQTEFEKQKELILTCTGKLIADMDSPSAEEVTHTVNCIKFELLFTSDKSLVDLEEKVQTLLTSTREKILHFKNNLETVNICTRAAVFNFEDIMEDNSDLIDLCVEEKSSQYSDKYEL